MNNEEKKALDERIIQITKKNMKCKANVPSWAGGTYWYTWLWPICVQDDFGDLVSVGRRDMSLEQEERFYN